MLKQMSVLWTLPLTMPEEGETEREFLVRLAKREIYRALLKIVEDGIAYETAHSAEVPTPVYRNVFSEMKRIEQALHRTKLEFLVQERGRFNEILKGD
jgi:hypothetical protein